MRIEKDSMGEMPVPDEALYGASTQRAVLNFPISGPLSQEHKFDVEKMGLSYLRRYGIPEALVSAIDREARISSQERAVMKPLCLAAAEMVEAFDANRWEKIAPGKTLPPKSSLRLMQIPDSQYLKIYERCSEYLFEARLLEERKKQKAATESEYADTAEIEAVLVSREESELQSEIQNLLRGGAAAEEDDEAGALEELEEYGEIEKVEEKDAFSLDAARTQQKEARVKPEDASGVKLASQPATSRARKIVETVESMFEGVTSSEEMISKLLEILVNNGPFEKSAVIVVSKDRKRALVVAARGPNIGNGQKLEIEDPLSPLAQCFSKIQSFGNKESRNSPWGSRSYAIAPLDADHDTPVALYADCGNNGAVPFEARRIFRTVVELLNQKLPQVAGGIPIEV